ncbi:hypothetical protein PFISCL1PPCAC_10460, partial [Pristionchus fissidentatus]
AGGASMSAQQTHSMHMGMRAGVAPGHDPNGVVASQRMMQQQQQQQQRVTPQQAAAAQQQWQQQQAQYMQQQGRPYGGTPQMGAPNQYMPPHFARAQQQQFPGQMGQQGMMGGQQPPPMVSSKPGEDGGFR